MNIAKDDVFQSVTQAYSEKEISEAPNRSRTYDLPISTAYIYVICRLGGPYSEKL